MKTRAPLTKAELQAALLEEKTQLFYARQAKLSPKAMEYIYRGWTPPQENQKESKHAQRESCDQRPVPLRKDRA